MNGPVLESLPLSIFTNRRPDAPAVKPFLGWTETVEGGAVAAYKTQRRERPEGARSNVGMAIEREIKLTNQRRGKEWEHCVRAVNEDGECEPSTTIMAVL